ncbi:MAG: hypothetical protein HWN65_06250 [Candidatus Helarchaeota archaeon]|nr:hypothetical protein [Candidatus Helarchaeota archaeon]
MEISKFIIDALKDGSIEKVSKGIEQLVMMMINAIGMIERREVEFEQQLETLTEDVEVIKSFLLSKPIPLPGSTVPPSTPAQSQPQSQQQPQSQPRPQPQPVTSPTSVTPLKSAVATGPTEEQIAEFRKKLLKPTPKHEKPKPQPVSIRAALMQEMKEYFGSALSKVEKEKKEAD